jgi:hypothetical protein
VLTAGRHLFGLEQLQKLKLVGHSLIHVGEIALQALGLPVPADVERGHRPSV